MTDDPDRDERHDEDEVAQDAGPTPAQHNEMSDEEFWEEARRKGRERAREGSITILVPSPEPED